MMFFHRLNFGKDRKTNLYYPLIEFYLYSETEIFDQNIGNQQTNFFFEQYLPKKKSKRRLSATTSKHLTTS